MENGDQTDYFRDGVTRILDLMRDTFSDRITNYFNGDPEFIGKSYYPCICVSLPQTEITPGATGQDNVAEKVMIKLVFNKLDDANADPNTDLTELKLRRMVQGQDPATGQWLPGTLMYALRTNLTLGNVNLNEDVQIAYDVNLRPDDTITQEAWVTVNTNRKALVPARV